MTRALLIALVLGGCGLFGARPPPAEDTPDHRACRAEADRAPAVRALDAQRNLGQQIAQPRLDEAERILEARAYVDCLRARGLALPGGVEAQRSR